MHKRILSYTFALLACSCIHSVCAEDENEDKNSTVDHSNDVRPALAQELADGPFVLSLDLAGFITAAAASKPTSIWWDPEAANNRAYISKQISILAASDSDMPPLIELLQHGQGAILVGHDTIPGLRGPAFACISDLGGASGAWKKWINKMLARTDDTGATVNAGVINDYQGFFEKVNPLKRNTSAFAGFNGNKILAGMVPVLVTPSTGVDSAKISGAPFTMRHDIGEIIKRIQYISENSDWDRYDYKSWGPFIGDSTPVVTTNITPESDGWVGTIQIEGIKGYSFEPVGESILTTIPSGSALWAIGHLDLNGIINSLAPLLGDNADAMATLILGTDIPSVAAWFSGDVSIAIKPAAPLPEITICIDLNRDFNGNDQGINQSIDQNSEAHVTMLLEKFLGNGVAQAMEIDGANKAWMIAAQGMPYLVYIGIGNGQLIASSNSMNITAIMKGQGVLDASAASGQTAYVHIDLPVIAQAYLPMVWGMTMKLNEELSRSQLQRARWDIKEIYQDLAQAEHTDATTLTAAIKELWRPDNIQALFPEGDLAENCLAHVSAWTIDESDNDRGDDDLILILRSQDAYHNLGSWNRETFNLEEIEDMLVGRSKLCGPEIADLPIIQLDPVAMLDAHWFPPLHTVIKHLPIYELSTRPDGPNTVLVTETGIPLASLFLSGAGSVFWFEVADRYTRILNEKQDQVIDHEVIEEMPAPEK